MCAPLMRRVYNTKLVKKAIAFAWAQLRSAWELGRPAEGSGASQHPNGDIPDGEGGVSADHEDDYTITNDEDDIIFDSDGDDALSVEDLPPPDESVPRVPLVFFRGESGIGKTYLARELVRLKDKVANGTDDAQVIQFAQDAVVFLLSVNSKFAIDDVDNDLVLLDGGAFLPLYLRLIYIEMADYKKLSWATFLSMAVKALEQGTLSDTYVKDEVRSMLRARRGASDAPLVIIVDELVLCRGLPASKYGAEYAIADDAYRSSLCRMADRCGGGVVGATTVSKAFVVEEASRVTPRDVLPGAFLLPLPVPVSRDILLRAALALWEKGLVFNSLGDVVRVGAGIRPKTAEWNLLLRVLVLVTGGHPRLVCNLASYMSQATLQPKSTIKRLLKQAGSSVQRSRPGSPMFGVSAEFTEAILRDLLLGTPHDYFAPVMYQQLLPDGKLLTKPVPRAGGAASVGYDYDYISTITAVGLLPYSGDDNKVVVTLPPSTLFSVQMPDDPDALPSLRGLVSDITRSHAALHSTSFETYIVAYDRALSLARYMRREEFKAVTFKDLYQSRAKKCFVGSSVLLQQVLVDASVYRENVEYGIDLEQVLELASHPKRRRQVLHSLYVLKDGTWGIDALMFHECVQDCGQYKAGDLIAEARQFKYSLDRSSTRLQSTDVDGGWSKVSVAFKTSWDIWQDRIVYVVLARRKGSVSGTTPAAPAPLAESKDPEQALASELAPGAADEQQAADADERPHAIVLGRSDLLDLHGPAFGGLMVCADYWLKITPFHTFKSIFITGDVPEEPPVSPPTAGRPSRGP